MKCFFNATILLLTIIFLCGCASNNIRGDIRKSNDNETYLIIKESCGNNNIIYVDGKVWPYKIGEKGKIKPGKHTLRCGGDLDIIIKEGTVFYFKYWGP